MRTLSTLVLRAAGGSGGGADTVACDEWAGCPSTLLRLLPRALGGGGGAIVDSCEAELPSFARLPTRREAASKEETLDGLLERTDALRAGGGGGGDSLLMWPWLEGGADRLGVSEEEAMETTLYTGWPPAFPASVSLSEGDDRLAGSGENSDVSKGLRSWVPDMEGKKPAADGDAKELEAREACAGRRGGGGAGAWTLTRRLEERDLTESSEDLLMDWSVSSCWAADITAGVLAGVVILLSDRPWGCRLGGGGGFLGVGDNAPVAVDVPREAFGGVGGRGG